MHALRRVRRREVRDANITGQIYKEANKFIYLRRCISDMLDLSVETVQ